MNYTLIVFKYYIQNQVIYGHKDIRIIENCKNSI